MLDRVKANNGTDNTITFADIPANVDTIGELIAYLEGGAPADITASNTATVAGTPLNKATLLSDNTANELGITDLPNATVDEAIGELVDRDSCYTAFTFPISSAYTGLNVELDSSVKIDDLKILKTQSSNSDVQNTAAKAVMFTIVEPNDGTIRITNTNATTIAIPLEIWVIRKNN